MRKAWTERAEFIYIKEGQPQHQGRGLKHPRKQPRRAPTKAQLVYNKMPEPCQFEKVFLLPSVFVTLFPRFFTWERLFPWESQSYNLNLGKISK